MTPRRLSIAIAVGLLVSASSASAGPSSTVAVSVDVSQPAGPLNADLVGFGWHTGGVPLQAVEPLTPHFVRVDASLQDVSVAEDQPLALDALLAKVAEVDDIGAEPLIILCYMPAWLGEPNAGFRDPTLVAPADLDAWQQLVHDVVLALATAPKPTRWFEAWNEPDIPLFWQDTPAAWVDTVERTALAIAQVEQETGLDLHFAGPATAVPDPLYLEPFLLRFRDPALPLDAVTWHYYGNYPFFGPDGAEFPITEPIQPVLGQQNPLATPSAYGGQIDVMRAWVDAGLAGSGRPPPDLVLDEWNLSAAGYDLRHDSVEGAAFAAGVLIEMQDTGLDASAFFRATDTQGVAGEHGAVAVDGTRKPVWWTFWLWNQLAAVEVGTAGGSDLDGLWVVGATDRDRVTVLLSSFSASSPQARTIELTIDGLADTLTAATIWRLDADHPTAETSQALAVDDATMRFELPAQAVALVELRAAVAPVGAPGRPGGDPGESFLPATGARSSSAIPWLIAGGLLAALAARRPRTSQEGTP